MKFNLNLGGRINYTNQMGNGVGISTDVMEPEEFIRIPDPTLEEIKVAGLQREIRRLERKIDRYSRGFQTPRSIQNIQNAENEIERKEEQIINIIGRPVMRTVLMNAEPELPTDIVNHVLTFIPTGMEESKTQSGGMPPRKRKQPDDAKRQLTKPEMIEQFRQEAGRVFFFNRETDEHVNEDRNSIRNIATQIRRLGNPVMADQLLRSLWEVQINAEPAPIQEPEPEPEQVEEMFFQTPPQQLRFEDFDSGDESDIMG